MKKTVTINLSGLVFQIDEDAFDRLHHYLEDIRQRFAGSEGSDEIVSDIEARIGEMFSEILGESKQVINIDDVNGVIAQMGQPEDFADIEDEDVSGTTAEEKKGSASKRLFRDPDDKVLGGVCSGISAYLGIKDPIWLRILFVVFLLLYGATFWVYIILWIIMPQAKTRADKLQMRGEAVTISNIERSIRQEINSLSNKDGKRKVRQQVHNAGGLLGELVKGVARVLVILIGLGFLLAGGGIILGLLSFFIPMGIASFPFSDFIELVIGSWWTFTFGTASVFIMGLLVAIGFIMLGIRLIGNRERKHNKAWSLASLGLFIISGAVLALCTVLVLRNYTEREQVTTNQALTYPATDTLYLQLGDDGKRFNYKDEVYLNLLDARMQIENDTAWVEGKVDFDILPAGNGNLALKQTVKARGMNRQAAFERAKAVNYQWQHNDSVLVLNETFSFPAKQKFRSQKVNLSLKLPVGTVVYLPSEMRDIIWDIKNVHDMYDGYMVNHYWMMTKKGLTCMDCDSSLLAGNKPPMQKAGNNAIPYNFSNFTALDISGKMNVYIQQDSLFSVYADGDQKFLSDLEIDQSHDELSISIDKQFWKFWSSTNKGDVYITMPQLEEVSYKGAVDLYAENFSGNELSIDAAGACNGYFSKLNYDELSLETAGACENTLSGKAQQLYIEMAGASDLYAYKLETEEAEMDLAGACDAEVYVTTTLNVDAAGACDIRYKGNPTVSSDLAGSSSIKQQ